MNKAMERAVALAGGQAALGRLIGKSQAGVFYMLYHAKRIKPSVARDIERAVKGEVKRWELCPEAFDPPADHGKPSAKAKPRKRRAAAE